MTALWPTVAEERRMELGVRAKRWGVAFETSVPWRSNGLFLSIVLFVFTLLTFGVGFVVRPIGAIVFGKMGSRIEARRLAELFSDACDGRSLVGGRRIDQSNHPVTVRRA